MAFYQLRMKYSFFCKETPYHLKYQHSFRITSGNKDIVLHNMETALFLRLWAKYLQKVKKLSKIRQLQDNLISIAKNSLLRGMPKAHF